MNKRYRSQKIRLGIFVSIGAALLLILLGFFTAKKLFEKTDVYFVEYKDVSVNGLEVGSPVRYLGIKVGAISDIKIDPKNISSIIVKLSLEPGTPIKEDAKANIVSMGITGLKTIEIRGGSNEADFLSKKEFIQAGSSFTEEITGKAEVIAEKVERVINNLIDFTEKEKLQKILDMADHIKIFAENGNKSLKKLDALIDNNKEEIHQTVVSAHEVTEKLKQSAGALDKTLTVLNNILEGDTLKQILSNTRDISLAFKETDLKELVENFSKIAKQTQRVLVNIDSDLNHSSDDLKKNLQLLKYTLENLNEISRKVNSNPSILLRGSKQNDIPDKKLKN